MAAPQKQIEPSSNKKPTSLDFEAKFSQWFEEWGDDLWTICVFTSHPIIGSSAGALVSVREEFQEMLALIRKRMRTRARRWPAEAVAGAFLKEWIRLQRLKHAAAGLPSVELPPQDRALVGAVFKVNWSFEKAAKVFDLSPTSVRYRALQALRRLLPLSNVGNNAAGVALSPHTRDCVRLELYVLDHLLGLRWKDPLQFFSAQDLERHRKSCVRCRAFCEGLEDGLKQMKLSLLPRLPEGLLERIHLESTLSSRWWLFTWISTWPWFFRIPLQLSFVAAVVFAVITVPYLGDLFPAMNRYMPSISDSIRRVSTKKVDQKAEAVVADAKPQVQQVIPTKVETPALGNGPTAEVEQKPAVALPPNGVSVAQSTPAPVPKIDPLAPLPIKAVAHQAEPAAAKPVAKEVAKAEVAKPVATPPPPPPAAPAVTVAKAAPAPEPQAAAPVEKPEHKAVAGKKQFYRWGAFTGNLDGDARKITAVLERYAVERAGEFDLGARHLGGAYYHFYVGEEDYDQLVEDIKSLGLEQFTRTRAVGEKKEQPEGQTRIVFLIRPKLSSDE